MPLKCGLDSDSHSDDGAGMFVDMHCEFSIYMCDSSHSLVGVREGKNPYRRMKIVTLKMFTVHMNIPVLDVLQTGHGVHMIYAN